MSERFISTDIWLSAFLLCENAQLDAVERARGKRKTVLFAFTGNNLTEKVASYRKAEASANVIELRYKINFLRDIIFQSKTKGTEK